MVKDLFNQVSPVQYQGQFEPAMLEHPEGAPHETPFQVSILTPSRASTWDGRLEVPDNRPLLHRKLLEWNGGSTLNCLLSDGKRLLAYHDKTAWKSLQLRSVVHLDGHPAHLVIS